MVKRLFLISSVALLLVVAVGHLLRDQIADAALDRALPALNARAAAGGFDCRKLRYARATLQGIGRLIMYQPECRLRIRSGAAATHEGDLALSADSAGVSLAPLLTGRLGLSVANGAIEHLDLETGEPNGQRIGEIAAQIVVPVPGVRVRRSA